jgi:hypothetical protein
VRIVRVVEEHLEGQLVVEVEPPGRLEERSVEGAETVPDVFELHAEAERHGGGEHGVLDVVERLALHGRRDEMRPQQRDVMALVVQRDHVSRDPLFEHDRPPAGADVLTDERMLRAHRHVADVLGLGVVGHLEHQGVVGVEHRRIGRHVHHHPLDLGELLDRIDVA